MLERRMPPPTQRRNTAYLNRTIQRFGALDRDSELRFALPTWTNCPLDRAAGPKGGDQAILRLDDLCVLTIELSGARADV